MAENYQKNSLLGQLEKSGIINDSTNGGEFLPFGSLSKGADVPVESPVMPEETSAGTQVETKIIKKRLNELDAEIFQESSMINVCDLELTDIEKIKKIKALIQKIDKKLYMLEDSDDSILIEKLKNEKETLLDALLLLNNDDPKMQPVITEIAGKVNLKAKVRKAEAFIFKMFPALRKNFLIRKALSKLIMLNESAKEAVFKKIPYGESETRYSDFIAYLSCANVIHAKLTKKM